MTVVALLSLVLQVGGVDRHAAGSLLGRVVDVLVLLELRHLLRGEH